VRGHRRGALPELDVSRHAAVVELVRELVAETLARGAGLLCGTHDVSGGGLGVALAEMALRSGVGCSVSSISGHAELFSELPSRIVVATESPDQVLERAARAGVDAVVLGRAGGDHLIVEGLCRLGIGELSAAFVGALPRALGEVG
jgi:phosphoribosylformylglycinamidine synthase subunit PurL